MHLAGNPDEADLADVLTSHVVTTAALLDACVAHRVSRFVYASSNHAVGRTPRASLADGVISDDALPRPDTFYGVGKVAAEALLRLYVDRYALDAVACRIGSFQDRARAPHARCPRGSPTTTACGWSRPRSPPRPPASRCSTASATTPAAWWDLEPGRRLGYEPLDDAEAYADRVGRARRR